MASKRKMEARAKRLARKNAQTKPGGASRYAVKRHRMLAGWENPRSPFRVSESAAAPVRVLTLEVEGDPEVLAELARDIEADILSGRAPAGVTAAFVGQFAKAPL